MKRNVDLIRKIMLHVEEHDNLEFAIDGHDAQTIAYHVRLLVEARLLHAVALTCMTGSIVLQDSGHTALTWEGHEFLDAARDEDRWHRAKAMIKEKAGTATVAALTQVLTHLMTQAINLFRSGLAQCSVRGRRDRSHALRWVIAVVPRVGVRGPARLGCVAASPFP